MTNPKRLPTDPRPAATTMLVRDGAAGLEAWMMTRAETMVFLPGAVVFPGGGVEPSDAGPDVPWVGARPETLALRMGTDGPSARALFTAAVRELFEETGVLLADSVHGVDLEPFRVALETRASGFAEILRRLDARLSITGIHPWARWVTPPGPSRRYDTWFFLVPCPADSVAAAAGSEAVAAAWLPVWELLEAVERGERNVLPPTRAMLTDLATAGSLDAATALAPTRTLTACTRASGSPRTVGATCSRTAGSTTSIRPDSSPLCADIRGVLVPTIELNID